MGLPLNSDVLAVTVHGFSSLGIILVWSLGGHHGDSVRLSHGHSIEPIHFAAAAALWSAVVHFCTWLADPLQEATLFSTSRWIDYFVSAGLMVVPAAVFLGQRDVYMLGAAAFSVSGTMLVASTCEALVFDFNNEAGAEASDVPRRSSTWIGAAMVQVAGLVMLFSQSGGTESSRVWTAVVALAMFAGVAVLSNSVMKRHKWQAVAVTGAATVAYAATWVALALTATRSANAAVAGVLIATHALFGAAFLVLGWCFNATVRANPVQYDRANAALSVFAKGTMHWLLVFNDREAHPHIWDSSVSLVLAVGVAVSAAFLFLCADG